MKCDNPECACNTDTSIKEEPPTNEDIQAQAIEGAEQAVNSLMHIAASGSETAAVAASRDLLDFYRQVVVWKVHEC